MQEVLNFNPGLVPNDVDGASCFLACSQMVLRTTPGKAILSFEELGKIIHRAPGEYSWEYGLLSHFAESGFKVQIISTFDLHRLVAEGNSYMYEYFGQEAADNQIKHSNMVQGIADVKAFLANSKVRLDYRIPQIKDIKSLLMEGFYLIPYLNQRMLQADDGYVAHTVFVYGFSERGVRMHNPGPPATEATEVAWSLFEKAWSSPSDEARVLFAVKPPDIVWDD